MGGPEAIGHRDPSRPVQQARGGLVRVGAVCQGTSARCSPIGEAAASGRSSSGTTSAGSLPGRRTSSVGRSKGMGS